jgi:hypothetical protein
MVEFMAAVGVPEDKICKAVADPQTNASIDPKTLRKHFRQELDRGHTKADTAVAQGLYKNATTPTETYPGGIPVAQIFWLKVRARWKPPEKDLPPLPPESQEQADVRDTARRLAFLLESGAQAADKAAAATKPATAKPKKIKISL